jgi:RimJ/RimL family protein N-acetyltransferase
MIFSERLVLRPWRRQDGDELARMCADPSVMVDYPRPQTREESNARLDRYIATFAENGFCRWALERRTDGMFIGYAGIQPVFKDHPLAPGVEIGWRMVRSAWGFGYASEAARVSLVDGFARCGLLEVQSYTTPENHRSQAVMRRIGLARETERDFAGPDGQEYIVFKASRSWLEPQAESALMARPL